MTDKRSLGTEDLDERLFKAGRLAEKLRVYSDEKYGEPLVEEGAEAIHSLVCLILEMRDDARTKEFSMKSDIEGLLRKWRESSND